MDSKPVLLDLFCCAGGAAMGYHKAGFEVVGIDTKFQPNYPFKFIQSEALNFLEKFGNKYDVVHASPPCQLFTATNNLTAARNKTRLRPIPLDLIDKTRQLLLELKTPYIIENVEGAPLREDLVLCGSMFDKLRVRRHRVFELRGFSVEQPICFHRLQERIAGPVIGVFWRSPRSSSSLHNKQSFEFRKRTRRHAN